MRMASSYAANGTLPVGKSASKNERPRYRDGDVEGSAAVVWELGLKVDQNNSGSDNEKRGFLMDTHSI